MMELIGTLDTHTFKMFDKFFNTKKEIWYQFFSECFEVAIEKNNQEFDEAGSSYDSCIFKPFPR